MAKGAPCHTTEDPLGRRWSRLRMPRQPTHGMQYPDGV
jgi:hypothetical protein